MSQRERQEKRLARDTRVAYGAMCTWWGSIHDVGHRKVGPLVVNGTLIPDPGALPCCPHCGGMLFETPEEDFIAAAQSYQNEGHPGYVDFVRWLKGRGCFTTIIEAQRAYAARHETTS